MLAIALALATGCAACGWRDGRTRETAAAGSSAAQLTLRMELAQSSGERYSSWFGDSDGRVLYFGLSPFWTESLRAGDPRGELERAGPHLVGRFELEGRRFLDPLVVRTVAQGARGSVWDVLAHSSGRIYYTTFFQEMGSVAGDGTEVVRFDGLGTGLNEIAESPRGELVVTRYGAQDPSGRHYGAVVWLSEAGESIRETTLPERGGVRIAPKSVAVDPRSGEVWLNADRFGPGKQIGFEWLRLARNGLLLERHAAPPELLFPAFDPAGRGWFVWDERGRIVLRVREEGREIAHLELEARRAGDFAQDVSFAPDGRALVTLWSGRVHVVELGSEGALRGSVLQFEKPPDCRAPGAPALLYSAVAYAGRVYATLSCGVTLLSVPLGR